MNTYDTLKILDECINELNSLTQDEFNNRLKEKGLYDKVYDDMFYSANGLELIHPREYPNYIITTVQTETVKLPYKISLSSFYQIESNNVLIDGQASDISNMAA